MTLQSLDFIKRLDTDTDIPQLFTMYSTPYKDVFEWKWDNDVRMLWIMKNRNILIMFFFHYSNYIIFTTDAVDTHLIHKYDVMLSLLNGNELIFENSGKIVLC